MDSLPHLLLNEIEHDNISRLNHMGRVGLVKHQLDLLLFGKEGTTEVNVSLETITEENNRALQRCGSLKCNEIDKISNQYISVSKYIFPYFKLK